MKKLWSLLVMVIFMTGMVVAQDNSATANQNGDKNSAGQTQDGSSNTATVDQNTPGANVVQGQTATQWQEGDDNEASIIQNTWGANSEGNTTTQEQYGIDNEASAKSNGSLNMVTQYQDGELNKSSLYTGGSKNTVVVNQYGISNVANGQLLGDELNMVNVMQDGTSNMTVFRIEYGDGNDVDIDQIGEDNKVGGYGDPGVHIWGSSNTVDIDQYGNQEMVEVGKANEASVLIEGEGNMSTIEQEGQYNMATHTMQGSAVDGNEAETQQDGYSNIAEVKQRSNNNVAFQLQDAYKPADNIMDNDDNNEADWNESYITQEGGTNNSAETYQFGDRNKATVVQDGNNNILVADQGIWDQRPGVGAANHGYDNVLEAKMKGDENEITAIQDGFNNTMQFDLYTRRDGSNDRNIIDNAYQLGGHNTMNVTVKGDDNTTFDFDQLGHKNTIKGLSGYKTFIYEGNEAEDFTIYQIGVANLVEGRVFDGTGIDLNINQEGYHNFSELRIHDWNNVIDINQVSPDDILMGERNEAFIKQFGGSNGAFVNQVGTNNVANIHQTH